MWVRTVCVFHKTLSDLQRQLLGKTRRKRYEVVRRGLGSAKKTTNEDLSWKKCCVIFFIYRCEHLPQECQRCVWPASDWWCARCTWSKRSEEVHRFSQMLTFTQIRQRQRERDVSHKYEFLGLFSWKYPDSQETFTVTAKGYKRSNEAMKADLLHFIFWVFSFLFNDLWDDKNDLHWLET